MSTFDEKADCLVYGYVSEEIKNVELEDKYPKELNLLIMQFLGNIFMRFDLIHSDYKGCIQNDGTVFKRGIYAKAKSFSAVSSYTFKPGDIGEFRIKCNKPGGDSIGIMDNTNIINYRSKYHSYIDVTVYYYHGWGNLYGVDGDLVENVSEHKFKIDDIITVKIDCNKWILTFMRNDKMVGKQIEIASKDEYYPFIGTLSNNVEYELISHRMEYSHPQ